MIVQRTETRRGFWDCHMTLYKDPNKHTNSPREIIIYCIPTLIYGWYCQYFSCNIIGLIYMQTKKHKMVKVTYQQNWNISQSNVNLIKKYCQSLLVSNFTCVKIIEFGRYESALSRITSWVTNWSELSRTLRKEIFYGHWDILLCTCG